MEYRMHDMASLFAQLGLPADPAEMDGFIAAHGPLPAGMLLHDAPFWTRAQAAFLREGVLEDSDWAEIIDVLNEQLHQMPR
jgi:hypothetical protein